MPCAGCHRCGDAADAAVARGEVDEGVGENLGVAWLRRFVEGFASGDVKGADAVEFARIFLCWQIAAAFFGETVDEHRTVELFTVFKHMDEFFDVVTVDRAVVTQPQLLEPAATGEPMCLTVSLRRSAISAMRGPMFGMRLRKYSMSSLKQVVAGIGAHAGEILGSCRRRLAQCSFHCHLK